jgi:diguanylate cyclase (GGDEF)-like protein
VSRPTFKRRVLSLAALLVSAVQLLTLLPVLNAVKGDVEQRARRSAAIAGVVFDEFMRGRTEQLRTTVDVLVSDFGFKQATAGADTETIRSALANHSARIDADIAMLLDLDGNVLASTGSTAEDADLGRLRRTIASPGAASAVDAVIYAGTSPYQILAVPLRAPLPIAWAVMGFQIDSELAARIAALTGLDVTFVDRIRGQRTDLIGSTLETERQTEVVAALGDIAAEESGIGTLRLHDDSYLTVMRPFSAVSTEVQVALLLSLNEAMTSYRSIRAILLIVTLLSLGLAVAGAYWLARTVTEPVSRLVSAARQLREGVYTERIEVPRSEELGELARSFNAMRRAIAEREQRIVHHAYHDALTGLPNRERFLALLEVELACGQPMSVISLSLDRYDQIASSLGHDASDEVVRLVADILGRNLRDGQLLGHLGANEFIVALPGDDPDAASRWVEHLRHLLHAGVALSGANLSLHATAGVAFFPEHSSAGLDLLRRAAVARANASAAHESFAVFTPGEEHRHRRQIKIIGDFPNAIANNELRLFVQPKIDCATARVVGVEALVRWEHPELGLLFPDQFVELIESAGSIAHLTRWVTRQAIAQCRLWRDMGLDLSVAINLSVHDLVNSYLPYNLLEIMEEYGLQARHLTLEVTESAIMHNVKLSLSVLGCIRDLGFGIALDDFGTGHSSLAQLRRLPVNELKIDKSFVMNMDSDKDAVIVRATIDLAHNLGMRVVAEGVETAELLERLREFGCEYAQGYHISRPIPADELAAWVRRWAVPPDARVVEFGRRPADKA